MNKITSIFKKKKFKYGATSIAFTCVCIALVITFNVIFSALSDKFIWSIDMTKEQLFTLSDASKDLLKDVDKDITIKFCMPLDTLETSERTNLVYQCAREYEKHFENIKIECIDIISTPTLVEKYSNHTNGSAINSESIIVESNEDFQMFSINTMFATDESTGAEVAFSGEKKFTTAILQLSEDKPIAHFTKGHGETIGTDGNRPALWTVFEEAGYIVKEIDLTKESFEDNSHVLVINGPTSDLIVKDETDEVDKIGKFLDRTGMPGNLMVFVDPSTPALPELESLIEEWGIVFEDAVIKDTQNSLSSDGLALDSVYSSATLGQQLTTSLQGMDSRPKAVSKYTRPLTIIWPTDSTRGLTSEEGYTTVTNTYASRIASPVLQSYNTATASSTSENSEFNKTAPYNLMTITHQRQIIENVEYDSYVLVSGSTLFASDQYLSASYSNERMLYSAMRVMGKENVAVELDHKYFHDDALQITKKAANNWTIVIVAVVPLIVFGIGLGVQIRRKHL